MKPVVHRVRWVVAGMLLGLIAALGAAFVWALSGVSAREPPSHAEAALARRLRHLAIPRAARDQPNPIPASDEITALGRAHWADHCASCHGNDGSGQTTIGKGLSPRVPDMRVAATQDLSDGELFYIIENGVRLTGMPAWGTGTAADATSTWHLVHFIRHLPRIGPDELIEMERLNPKSQAEVEDDEETRRFLDGDGPAENEGDGAAPAR